MIIPIDDDYGVNLDCIFNELCDFSYELGEEHGKQLREKIQEISDFIYLVTEESTDGN